MAVYISINQEQHDQLADKMARLACAAYYRAKLEGLYFGGAESRQLEERLRQLTDDNWQDWLTSAKAFLSMAYVIVKSEAPNGA